MLQEAKGPFPLIPFSGAPGMHALFPTITLQRAPGINTSWRQNKQKHIVAGGRLLGYQRDFKVQSC